VTNAVRPGKKRDKARLLLKITVDLEENKVIILHNAVKLQNHDSPEKIFIATDMS